MTNSALIIAGGVIEAFGIGVTVIDLRAQQRRLASHEPPEPSLGPPKDPTQHLVGQKTDGPGQPWHDNDPLQRIVNVEHALEGEKADRQEAAQALVSYLDDRIQKAVRDVDRRRLIGDDRVRDLMGSLTDWQVMRGPLAFIVGLTLQTIGSLS